MHATQNKYYEAEQLTLAVRRHAEFDFDSFYGDKNNSVARALQGFAQGVSITSSGKSGVSNSTKNNGTTNNSNINTCASRAVSDFIFLIGPECSGKTHLMQAAINECDKVGDPSLHAYFCLKEFDDNNVSLADFEGLFESLENYSVLALDNIDAWLSGSESDKRERMLFNLFNHYRNEEKCLITSSSKNVDGLACGLPDLVSRLKSGVTLRLKDYDDEEKIEILIKTALSKGLILKEDVASFIIKRADRQLKALVEVLSLLDKVSLAEQRKLTIPFIKKVLNW